MVLIGYNPDRVRYEMGNKLKFLKHKGESDQADHFIILFTSPDSANTLRVAKKLSKQLNRAHALERDWQPNFG
jgi:hypothetical protein